MVWTLAIIVSTMTIVPIYLLSKKHAWYIWVSFPLTYPVIVCCCNIGIWRKCQNQRVDLRMRQISATKNKRLTKTLLLVSFIAVVFWLPLVINNYLIFFQKLNFRRGYLVNGTVDILNYSNSFSNPVVNLCIENPWVQTVTVFVLFATSSCDGERRFWITTQRKSQHGCRFVAGDAVKSITNSSQLPTASFGPELYEHVQEVVINHEQSPWKDIP